MLLARYRENVAAERIVSLPDIVASSPPSTGRKFVNELNVADIDDNMVLVKMEQIIKVEGHMEELLIEEVMMVEDDMEGVMIEKSDMKQARMEEGNVEDVMMEEAYMTEVKMEQDDTKQSIMGQADMEQAELESANESNVTKVNIADRVSITLNCSEKCFACNVFFFYNKRLANGFSCMCKLETIK